MEAAGAPEMPDVDDLAKEIRRVDGRNSRGAGDLAEQLMPFLRAYGQAMAEHARTVALEEAAKLCDKFKAGALAAQNGKPDDLESVMLRQIAHLGHGECAAAIRAAAQTQGGT
jgi:hypothetical protein